MKRSLVLLGLTLVLFSIYVTFCSPSTTIISPMSSTSHTQYSMPHTSYIIMGFAPYWNLKKLSPESLSSITHLAYFHLLVNGDGTIYKKTNKREEDPGFTNYKRLLTGSIDHGKKPLIITFMPESQTALASSLSNSNQTIQTIKNILTESGASGVNIDYEPLGDISPTLRSSFTSFIKDLRDAIPNHQISISIYASSAVRPRIWDLAALSDHTDYFVVMTYDYTMPGNSSAGPNSPLRGSGDRFEHDIIKNIAQITKLVPSKKVLLGIPFYGYEWETIDGSKYSLVESKGSVASLERVDKMIQDKTLELVWDRNTLTPYGISTESGKTSQIYFENETSIKLKLEFVKSANLGGIAIWALGYEGNNSWVWPTINKLNL